MQTEIKTEALCLKTSLTLFECDKEVTLESRTNGVKQTNRSVVADKNLTTEDYMEQGNEFIIGTAPQTFEENRVKALLAIRRTLTREFDHLVDLYLPSDQAEKYKEKTLEIEKFICENILENINYVIPKEK